MVVPVVDIFAGPGGLSEGFEGCRRAGRPVFQCALSIEKDSSAHQTLLLRTFLRQFNILPTAYYSCLRGERELEALYRQYPRQYETARSIAVRLTLAPRNAKRVDALLTSSVKDMEKPWVLIGGPPCQAYSVAGRARRSREERSDFERDGRHFLYKEYLRILKKFRPSVFVMENVKGLLSSSAKGIEIFSRMLEDFAGAGYRIHSCVTENPDRDLLPGDYVIKAEHYGIPQRRHRVILLGVRQDVTYRPRSLQKSDATIPIEDAIGDLPRIRSRVSPPTADSTDRWLQELRKLRSAFRHSGVLKANGHQHSLVSLQHGAPYISFESHAASSQWLKLHGDWFLDSRIDGVTLHEGRHHMPTDLRRYLYASLFARQHDVSPRIRDFPAWIRPEHENIKKAVKEKLFADRFRVQVQGQPATTIVSHISKDGHYYIHYDYTQCRSLTVREAARLQTFPDNYFFVGSRTEQYQQVGNAVPPLLARQIARLVAETLN
jgi:DNA (cytosine-5)-methyltransferase 1